MENDRVNRRNNIPFQTVETVMGIWWFIYYYTFYMFQISHIRMLKKENVRALYQNIYMTGKTLKIKS